MTEERMFPVGWRHLSSACSWSARGVAGLTAANALTHAGVECVVLEARDRIGGRLHTVDVGGSPVDLGGSWIHMPDGNPMSAFARLAGVSCGSADPVPEMAGFDCGEGRRLSAAEAGDVLGLYLEGFAESAEGLLAELGPDAFPHLMVFPRDPEEWMVWVMGQDAFGGGPVLVFFVFHSAAERLAGAGTDASVRWALGMLAEAIGRPCPEPAAVAVSSWAADPWTEGAYTHIPPGASPADADLLGEPVGGRLLFAGEHTQSARLAYADGALTSGVREAKRLLGTPAVRISVEGFRWRCMADPEGNEFDIDVLPGG